MVNNLKYLILSDGQHINGFKEWGLEVETV